MLFPAVRRKCFVAPCGLWHPKRSSYCGHAFFPRNLRVSLASLPEHPNPLEQYRRAIAATFLVLCCSVGLFAQSSNRPNVLFFAVDDLRTDLGCYGHPEAKTPSIDALARRGMVFKRAYCQQAVCSPSRTSLLTGLRPDSTKVYDLITHFRDTVPDVVTLPQHFKNNGYHAVGMGKIFHGGLDDKQSWSEPHRNGTGETYVLPENQERVAKSRAAKKAANKGKKKTNASDPGGRGEPFEIADVPDNAYHDGTLADMAIEKLSELKNQNQPFFLAVGFLKPHLPFNAPKKYWDLYDPEKLKLADNPFRPKDAPPFALTEFAELRNYYGVPAEGPVPDELARKLIHAYRAASGYTDANVGRVVAQLDKLGLAENTIVVLWGDHGWKLGEHASWCKHSNVENDTNAPLLIAAPSAKAKGQSTTALVEFVDIYPTLCDLAALPLPGHLEGTSARPLLDTPDRPWKTAAFSQYPRPLPGQPLMGYAMRTDRYRYVEWQDRNSGQIVTQELYDHQSDPAENENIAVQEANKELLTQLSAQLKAGWQQAKTK
jgi:iduronate 2-sulfatase